MDELPETAATKHGPRHGIAIEDASAWVLRVGVIASVVVMITGLVFSFVHHRVPVERMQSDRFDFHVRAIWAGIRLGQGKAIVEAGIYLLVLTPIMRVVTSMVLFAVEDHDWLYALITFLVLAMTVGGFALLR